MIAVGASGLAVPSLTGFIARHLAYFYYRCDTFLCYELYDLKLQPVSGDSLAFDLK